MPYKSYLRPVYPNELYHHGIKGQKWGVRRFQNPDGTLTAAGKQRYNVKGTNSKDSSKKESNMSIADLCEKYGYEEDSDEGVFTKEDISSKYPDTTITIDAKDAKRHNVKQQDLIDTANRLEKKSDSIIKSAIDGIMKEQYQEISDYMKDPSTGRKLTFDEFKKDLESGGQIEVYPMNGKTKAMVSFDCPAPYKGRIEYIGNFVCVLDDQGNFKFARYDD